MVSHDNTSVKKLLKKVLTIFLVLSGFFKYYNDMFSEDLIIELATHNCSHIYGSTNSPGSKPLPFNQHLLV